MNPTDKQVTQMVADMQSQLDTCSQAGQAYRVKWHEVKTIIETIQSLQERLSEAKKWQMSVEEREAAVCPEDVGFDEYIRHLESKLAATPPDTPSDAAMRAAEEIIGLTHSQDIDGGTKRITTAIAAIITRHLPVPAAAPDPGTLYWTKDADGYPILDAVTAAATTSPETPVGGEASYDQIVQAITDIEGARESHVQWANHLRLPHTFECQGCIDHAAHIGDADYHDEWIAKYNNVINVLFSINPFKRTTP